MVRKIVHLDMDAFYASVEQRDHLELRGRPLVVGGDPSGRGVVATASYEARAFGVRSAMPASTARRLCPDLVFVRPRMAHYKAVSRQMRAILERATDLIEPLSLDECYLDVTTNKLGLVYAQDVAELLRRNIREELGLTASAGVGSSKLVAKIASDIHKPDGLCVVAPEREAAFLAPLPVEKLWGVGPATAARLHALGARTVGELAELPALLLRDRLGKHGAFLHRLARGDDPREVSPHRVRKSFGREHTFSEDVVSAEVLRTAVERHVDEVVTALRGAGRRAARLTVKVRYDDFETVTRATTLAHPTTDPAVLAAAAAQLLARTEAGERPVRLVGVSAGVAAEQASRQLELDLRRSFGTERGDG